MRKLFSSVLLFCVASVTAVAAEEKFGEIGIFSPVQIRSEEDQILGLRLGMFYTENNGVSGLDMNLIVGRAKGSSTGAQLSLVNLVAKEASGFQMGLFNSTGGMSGLRLGYVNLTDDLAGAELGLVNVSKKARWFQMGLVNVAGEFHGFQLGLVNIASELYGLQFGLINVASNAMVSVLPVVNWNF